MSVSRKIIGIIVFRIGLIGLGAASRNIHLPACHGIADVVIVGGVDVAAISGVAVPRFASLDDLVSKGKPDLIIIATPPASHVPLAIDALRAGCHVFLEKPIAPSLAEARTLRREARKSNRKIAVNNEFRFMACHAAARRLVGTLEFGDLRFLHLNQTFRVDSATEAGWRGQETERTGTEFGIHALDLARFFFNSEPHVMRSWMAGSSGAAGPDMLNLIDLDFGDGRFARITLDRLTKGKHRYLECRLDGTNATIETELGGALELQFGVRAANRRPFFNGDFSPGGRAFLWSGEKRRKIASDGFNLFADATRKLLQAFLQAIRDGTVPSCSLEDNFRSFALMRGAYDAARERRDVDVAALYQEDGGY
jgi:predicted dehydrogenase